MKMSKNSRELIIDRLAEEFSDAEYAHSYMKEHSISRLAAQIHAMRKQRGWSQEKLSETTGIAQETISKIESANFESLTTKTLRRLAEAFDVHLKITFESFSEGIQDVVNLSPEKLKVDTREKSLTQFKNERRLVECNPSMQVMRVLPLNIPSVMEYSGTPLLVDEDVTAPGWHRAEPIHAKVQRILGITKEHR